MFFLPIFYHLHFKVTKTHNIRNSYFLVRRTAAFTRLTPSTPKISKPPYCAVFAKPKNTTHNVPFKAALIGSSICAKEMTYRGMAHNKTMTPVRNESP